MNALQPSQHPVCRLPRGRLLPIALTLLTLSRAGCSREGYTNTSAEHAAPTADAHAAKPSAPKKAEKSEAVAGKQKIHIDNFTYHPAKLTVAVGTEVTWVNRDDVPHTATSTAKPKTFDSKTLDTDETFSFVFDKAGTYEYFCAVHPKMTGRVIVK